METKKSKLPFGLRFIRVLLILNVIFSVILFVTSFASFVSNGISDWISLLFLIIGTIGSILLIYCIKKPSFNLYKIALILSVVSTLSVVPDLIKSWNLDIVILSLIEFLFWWYLLKIKNYFKTGFASVEDPSIKSLDKKFKILFSILILFLAGSFVFTLISANKSNLELVSTVESFKGKTAKEALDSCQSLSSSESRNLCIISVIGMGVSKHTEKEIDNSFKTLDVTTCDLLDGNYKPTCYATFDRCDLITDDIKLNNSCKALAEYYKGIK